MNDQPQNLNRTTAIIILIIIIVIIGVGGYFILKGSENNNLSLANKDTNISEWRTFRNEKIGISFIYPLSYNPAIIEEVSKEKESPGVLMGKGIRIYFGEDIYAFSFLASSSDYEGFKQNNYHGKKDISKICQKLSVYDEKSKGLCLPITIAGQETIQKFSIEVDEGVVFVGCAVYLDLSSNEYPNLAIGQTYPELAYELQGFADTDNEETFSQKAKVIIENLQQKKDLPTATVKQLDDFDRMLSTLKLL